MLASVNGGSLETGTTSRYEDYFKNEEQALEQSTIYCNSIKVLDLLTPVKTLLNYSFHSKKNLITNRLKGYFLTVA